LCVCVCVWTDVCRRRGVADNTVHRGAGTVQVQKARLVGQTDILTQSGARVMAVRWTGIVCVACMYVCV
jgi:hypothetical protein